MQHNEHDVDSIDTKALKKRNTYIKGQKVSGKVKKKKSSQTIAKNNNILAGSFEKKTSILGKNSKVKDEENGQSGLLGKSRESALKRRNANKSLSKYVYSATAKCVRNTAAMAKEQIKNIAVQTKKQELMSSQNPSDAVAMLGEKGITGAVKFSGMIVRSIIKTIGKVIVAIFSSIGIYITISIIAIMLIFIITIAGVTVSTEKQASSTVNNEHVGTVVGSVKKPRIEGTSTELTYRQVYNSKWYSSHVGGAGGGTFFSGDNGLDKWRGDRGGNCTAYAWGRRCELEGERTQLGANGDAYFWYARELAAGIYKTGQTARVGAVCCWSYGYSKDGHVAVVEKINKDGSIVTSNSAYGSRTGIPVLFYNDTFKDEETLKNSYGIFQGYIYLEKK